MSAEKQSPKRKRGVITPPDDQPVAYAPGSDPDAGFNATDKRIDNLAYELYGLTDDEIRIVEEATA